jgi:hypothetical protein
MEATTWTDSMLYHDVPDYTMRALEGYRAHGHPPGGFLRSVLENAGLVEVVGRADDRNARALQSIARWVYNELPHDAWGSKERVDAWVRAGGAT